MLANELNDDDGVDFLLSQISQEVESKQSTMKVVSKQQEKLKTFSKILEVLNLQNCTNVNLNFH